MHDHVHSGIEEVVFITLAALVGFTVLRYLAITMSKSNGSLTQTVGTNLGGILRFGN